MSADWQPDEINRRWSAAMNKGDVQALLDLYEPDAVVVPGPGAGATRGHDAIREALTWLVGLGGAVTHQPRCWLRCGDIAMGSITFQLNSANGAQGEPLTLAGTTAEVIRRQPDGTWKYLIDHPFAFGS